MHEPGLRSACHELDVILCQGHRMTLPECVHAARTASAAACASASAALAAASSAWCASDAAPDSRAARSSASLPFSSTCARACAQECLVLADVAVCETC